MSVDNQTMMNTNTSDEISLESVEKSVIIKDSMSKNEPHEVTELSIQVMNYDDYRVFLRDWYNAKKKSRFGYSYQRFSQKAGFASPNFFKQILDGHRNLSEESLGKFIQVIDFSEGESQFFRTLVLLNQATSNEEQIKYAKQLELLRKTYLPMVMSQKHTKILSLWYSFAIRELIMHPEYDGTHEWICKKMSARVNVEQVEQALNLLEAVGLVSRNEEGRLVQSDPVTFFPGALSPKEVAAYHRQMLSIVNNVLMNDRKPFGQNENIDISSLTLGVSQDKIPIIKNKISQFRKEILSLVAEDTRPDEVILLSLQMVPLTK